MATYLLVPGAWHGAWCWERIAPLIRGAGHEVVAIDLPCEDASVGCAGYRDIALEAVRDAGNDLVVVGHSVGGEGRAAAARRRLRRHPGRRAFLDALSSA